MRVQVLFTRLMGALATAYRLACAREARGEEPVGWQRWRRQRLEQTRDQVIVWAQGYSGLFPLAEDSLRLGVKRKMSRLTSAAAHRSGQASAPTGTNVMLELQYAFHECS